MHRGKREATCKKRVGAGTIACEQRIEAGLGLCRFRVIGLTVDLERQLLGGEIMVLPNYSGGQAPHVLGRRAIKIIDEHRSVVPIWPACERAALLDKVNASSVKKRSQTASARNLPEKY